MKFKLPVMGEWLVFSGGEIPEENLHNGHRPQDFAIDMVPTGQVVGNLVDSLTDYPGFGQKLYAPADGQVVQVVDGMPDNEPGYLDGFMALGNHVIIRHAENVYSVIAHIKKASSIVSEGEEIKQGQELGVIGNSGNTTEPHLHMHIMSSLTIGKRMPPKFQYEPVAESVELVFENILVNGEDRESYKPRKNDIISNIQ
ncbi:MAG: M23 family metallopeptidase [Patescibacteria group bacterium]